MAQPISEWLVARRREKVFRVKHSLSKKDLIAVDFLYTPFETNEECGFFSPYDSIREVKHILIGVVGKSFPIEEKEVLYCNKIYEVKVLIPADDHINIRIEAYYDDKRNIPSYEMHKMWFSGACDQIAAKEYNDEQEKLRIEQECVKRQEEEVSNKSPIDFLEP